MRLIDVEWKRKRQQALGKAQIEREGREDRIVHFCSKCERNECGDGPDGPRGPSFVYLVPI